MSVWRKTARGDGSVTARTRTSGHDWRHVRRRASERRRSRWRSRPRRIAEDLPEEGRQPSQRSDAGDPAGGDVLDAPEHAARRLRTSVEMEYERPVGGKLEGHRTRGLIRQRSVSFALP